MPTIKVDGDQAQRLIARHLREANHSPAAANELASQIVAGLIAATVTTHKQALTRFKMIPPDPTTGAAEAIFRHKEFKAADLLDVHHLWRLVYDQGIDPPSDVEWTDR